MITGGEGGTGVRRLTTGVATLPKVKRSETGMEDHPRERKRENFISHYNIITCNVKTINITLDVASGT